MTQPLAYEPEYGYQYQILTRYGNDPWEHCDYATNAKEKSFLIKEYRMAYGSGYSFKIIYLPRKYHQSLDNTCIT